MSGPKILLLDIETAPHRVYAWGLWQQDIGITQIEEPGYTLSWAAKWYGSNKLFFGSIHTQTTRQMLKGIYDLIDEADIVVHYNGNKFDMPILNQEFMVYGFSPPSPVINIDLLATAKRRFRLPSNKLDYVARYLKIRGKLEHKGMALWRDCMKGKDAAWRVMELYNKRDVLVLEEVYNRLKAWVPNHPNHGLFAKGNAHVCPNCGSLNVQKRGTYYTHTLSYQRYRCSKCGAWSRSRTTITPQAKRSAILKGVI